MAVRNPQNFTCFRTVKQRMTKSLAVSWILNFIHLYKLMSGLFCSLRSFLRSRSIVFAWPNMELRSQDKPGTNFIIVSDTAAGPLNSDTSFDESTSKTIASKFVHAPSFNNKAGIPMTEPLNSLAA
jgi:hypothetical protein